MMTKQSHQRSMSAPRSVPTLLVAQIAACVEWFRVWVGSGQPFVSPEMRLSTLPVRASRRFDAGSRQYGRG